jgi:hypothetical protein
MKSRIKNIKITILAGAITMVAMLTLAMTHHQKHLPQMPATRTVRETSKKGHSYDPVVLREFEKLSEQLDFNRQNCTYAGSVNAFDGADTSVSAENLAFLFSRHSSAFYYRVGNTETIHQDGINLFIQHDLHKVVLSDNPMLVQSPTTDLSAIEKKLNFEDYDLVSTSDGKNRTIAAVNPTHITCKELALTCDTLSGKLVGLSARFSNLADPLNKKMDRVVTMTIDEIENSSSIGKYTRLHQVIEGKPGSWRLKGRYADYELILL